VTAPDAVETGEAVDATGEATAGPSPGSPSLVPCDPFGVECLLRRKNYRGERNDAFAGMAFARTIDGSDSDEYQGQKRLVR
jgi:hypothetical protein